MLRQFMLRGFSLTQEPSEAEVIVVNTCSFIESATEESIETILEAGRLKEEGRCQALVVSGCFPQRYKNPLVGQLPEVDLFLGTESFLGAADQVLALLEGRKTPSMILEPDPGLWDEPRGRLLTTAPGSAYLKIAEGCSNRCAYCTIPTIRGVFRSRDPLVLLEEARVLAQEGVRELILVAQDTTAYGSDLVKPITLVELLEDLVRIESFQWLRLLYLRPERVTPSLLALMAREEKLCPYLDIPIQHVSDRILKAMNRPYGHQALRNLFKRIREAVPRVALRTTVMVGFPGETEEFFDELNQFISETAFDHLGVFSYSPEEGTPAAGFPDPVPEAVRQARRELLMERQKGISLKKNRSRIGTLEPVLVTGTSPESDLLIQGRARFQAPEVDGVVYIADGEPKIGEIVPVRITEAHHYDLVGVVTGKGR